MGRILVMAVSPAAMVRPSCGCCPTPRRRPPPGEAIEGVSNGVVAQGTVVEGDVGVSISFDDLRTAIAEGRADVNVHTNDFVGPPNKGPGDFPGGEIRGELR